MFTYKAKIIKVYDGDTVTADIDCGFHIHFTEKVRLYGIDAPEIRGKERPKGLKARDYLRALILDKEIILETIKDKKGKYGRYLGHIILDGVNINEKLVKDGHAKFRKY